MENTTTTIYGTTQGNLVSENETHLVWAAQEGELEAFNQLVLVYQDRIFSLTLRILGDEDSADDITQTTFLNAYLGLPRLRNGSFRTWLNGIAINACYDELRRRKRYSILPLETEETAEERPLPSSVLEFTNILPEKEYAKHEFEQIVRQALYRLNADYRVVVVLIDMEGYSYREAGQILGIPPGTVKSRLARGRSRLHSILRNFELFYGNSI